MMIFLILAPYAAFAALLLVSSAAVSVFATAGLCMAVIAYDALTGRSLKMLGAGSVIVFAATGGYLVLVDPTLSCSAVKLIVDLGMLVIALTSLVIRRPFTLQYARETADAELLARPEFVQANYVITAVWSLAFVLMVVANVLMIYLPGLPLWAGLVIAFAARNSALYFSAWYPEHQRRKFAAPAATAL
jgi:hypothetical protein